MAEQKTITVPVKVKLRPKLIRAAYRRVRDLTLELERTEGDLAVAVAEATTARAALAEANSIIEQMIRLRQAAQHVEMARDALAAAGAAQPEETLNA